MPAKPLSQLITELNTNINTNGNREITGAVLNAYLRDMLDSMPNSVDGFAASLSTVIPIGNLTSLNVQLALQELQGDIDTINAGANVLNNFSATAPPAVTNDNTEGYAFGSKWLDRTNKVLWVCADAATGAAVWFIDTHYGIQKLTDAAIVEFNTNLGIKAELDNPASNRTINFATLPADITREGYINVKGTNGVTLSFTIANSNANVYIFNDGQGDTAQGTTVGATSRDSFVWVWDGVDLWITYSPNFTQT